jgi:hypothetical protein
MHVIMIECFKVYLNSGQNYFGKIVGHARKWVGWQNENSLNNGGNMNLVIEIVVRVFSLCKQTKFQSFLRKF